MKSFVFHEDWLQMIDSLPEGERWSTFKAIANYSTTGTMPTDGISLAIVLAIKPFLDSAQKKREAGSKGGRPKKPMVSEEKTNGFKNKNQIKPNVTNGFENKNHEKPMVSEEKTNGFSVNNQWFPNEKPMVSEEKTNGFAEVSKEHSPHTPFLEKEKEKENNNINIITKESEKEARQTFKRYRQAILKYGDGLIHQGWREVMEKQHGIQNWEQAFTDFSDHIEAHSKWDKLRQTSFNDFKSWFNNAAELFLTDEAKQKPRPKPKLVCEEFYRDGKRFVRQYDREIEIPLDARPRPMPIERYEWEPDQFDWVPIG